VPEPPRFVGGPRRSMVTQCGEQLRARGMQEVVAAEPIRNLINPARIGRYGRPGAPESTPTSTDSPKSLLLVVTDPR
jgi:hypothetical protein